MVLDLLDLASILLLLESGYQQLLIGRTTDMQVLQAQSGVAIDIFRDEKAEHW